MYPKYDPKTEDGAWKRCLKLINKSKFCYSLEVKRVIHNDNSGYYCLTLRRYKPWSEGLIFFLVCYEKEKSVASEIHVYPDRIEFFFGWEGK